MLTIHRGWAFLGALVALWGCSASSHGGSELEVPPAVADADESLVIAELNTVGWDSLSNSPVVLLREIKTGEVLPIWIGIAEARAISLALHEISLPRPMTHDLMAKVLADLHVTLEEVHVTELRDNTYYGLLKLRVAGEDEVRWVDSRPSDGLALALRTDATIRISRKLLEEQREYRFLAPQGSDQVVRVLGMTVVAADDALREEFALPERDGLVVIAAGGVAEEAGLRRGDLLLALGGKPARQPLDLLDALSGLGEDGSLAVTFWRAGEERTLEIDPALVGPAARRDRVA